MRGKKSDTDFVAAFIATCAQEGKIKPEDICNAANVSIKMIDDKIKEVEELKKRRSKLIDVINTLDKKVPDKSKDKTDLSFYGISNVNLANSFCLYLQSCGSLEISQLATHDIPIVKQLFAINILKRKENNVVPGEKIQEFLDFTKKVYHL